MIAYLRSLTLRNIVSPYGLAAISYCIFLFAWLFPPGLYTQYIEEPDLMFLDPSTFVFFSCCVGAFLLGVRFVTLWHVKEPDELSIDKSAEMPLLYLVIPIVVSTVLCAVYMVMTGSRLNSLTLLAAQQGNLIKIANQTETQSTKWAIAPVVLTAVLWWSFFRSHELKLAPVSKFIFNLICAIGALVGIITCVVTVDRTSMMPLIAGLFIIYVYWKAQVKNVSLRKLLFMGTASMLSLVGGFLALSFLRGALVLRLLLISLLGYSIVSYNRLAALLAGIMHYAYAGRGVYLATVLEEKTGLQSFFGWPNTLDLWRSEFSSTFTAGLNSFFIWSGAFGYLYSDIGWWTLLYLFLIGILAGWLWRRFRSGLLSGLILYPWMGFSILFWIGWNLLFDGRALRFIGCMVLLWIYESIFLRRGIVIPEKQGVAYVNDRMSRPIVGDRTGGTS
jgi:hypothetical protein